ncbi:hypothetical protein NNC19_10885 [Clostridium sp. SHJSY1]|uniref:hypothetical protein n=1 Tax=Clostridium sp. SHJSY1 TaxID=2942483 RepID=UPI002876B124|nr:hypothetical protein [Clostridium sp. SHJSY1]MDS0526186.1 hypothetical protein [Clostridium sp. SHJSY1]
MSAKIVLENDLKSKIPYMSGKKYFELLMSIINENVMKDENLKKFSVYRRNQFYKYMLHIPVFKDGTKVSESKEQRKKRIELRDSLMDKFRDGSVAVINDVIDINKYIERNEVVKILNICKKHFDVICNSTGAIRTIIYKQIKYVEKESLLNYLGYNHFTGTGVSNFQIIDGLIGSEEYFEAWNKYADIIPKHERVVKETASQDDLNSGDIKRIYNIYIKIANEELAEIPKLYPIGIFAKNFNMNHRSLLRYCQKGILNYYKIGNKYMLSQSDYDKSFELIQRYKEKPKKKGLNRGKKSKYEELLIELNLGSLIHNDKFKELTEEEVKSYFHLKKIKTDSEKNKEYYNRKNLNELVNINENHKVAINIAMENIVEKIKEKAIDVL